MAPAMPSKKRHNWHRETRCLKDNCKSKCACILEASESTRMRMEGILHQIMRTILQEEGTIHCIITICAEIDSCASSNESSRSEGGSGQRMEKLAQTRTHTHTHTPTHPHTHTPTHPHTYPPTHPHTHPHTNTHTTPTPTPTQHTHTPTHPHNTPTQHTHRTHRHNTPTQHTHATHPRKHPHNHPPQPPPQPPSGSTRFVSPFFACGLW